VPNVIKSVSLKFVLCSFLIFSVCQLGSAQHSNGAGDVQLQGDVSVLKQEVKALGAQQRQILEQLNELKQMLQANPPGRTAPPLPSTVAIQGEPFRGDSGARVAIVEYADFECPYCGKHMRETYPQILDNYIQTGKVKYFFRDLPLPMHSHAMPAARAARCAGEQDKYWQMHDSLFANQGSLINKALLDRAQSLGLDTAKFEECLSSQRYLAEIRNSMVEAQKMGISGTPTFFLGTIGPNADAVLSGLQVQPALVVNIARAIRGTVPYEAFKTALDELLAQTDHEK